MTRAVLTTIAACALAWAGWIAAGWAVGMAGLGELDLPARVCAVFLVLGFGETGLAWLSRNDNKGK